MTGEGRTVAKEKSGGTDQVSRKAADSRLAELRKSGDVMADALVAVRHEVEERTAALEKRMDEADGLWVNIAAAEQKSIEAGEKAERAEQTVTSASQKVTAMEAEVEKLRDALVAEFNTTDDEGKVKKIKKEGKELIYLMLERSHKANTTLGGVIREAQTTKKNSEDALQKHGKLREEFDEWKREIAEILETLYGLLEKAGLIPKKEGGDS